MSGFPDSFVHAFYLAPVLDVGHEISRLIKLHIRRLKSIISGASESGAEIRTVYAGDTSETVKSGQ